jgi:hypothetical protein
MVGPKKQDLWPKIYILKQKNKKKSVDDLGFVKNWA